MSYDILNPAIRILIAAAVMAIAAMAANGDEIEEVLNGQRNFNAVQEVYTQGVPHTDRQGKVMMKYDPDRSFFQIAAWGVPHHGTVHDHEYDWTVLQAAGYNTVWPWPVMPAEKLVEMGREQGLQVVLMQGQDEATLAALKDNPYLLGNVWWDEPIGKFGTPEMETLYADFVSYRERARELVPDLNVFINDAPWITPPATSWWIKWNTSGDVSCHDNYPIQDHTARAQSIGADPGGIPQSIALAVAANKEQKPVWLIVGAFETPGPYGQAFPFRHPTPEQLRACVYSGIIHGATGIIYFIWDSYVSRDGSVIGMSPDPQVAYAPNPRQEGATQPFPATPMQMVRAKALWDAASQINKELMELTPVILSPTVSNVKCSVTVTGKAPTSTPIRALLKSDGDGGYILMTVNQDDAVLKAGYKFPKALKSVEVLFENRLPETVEDGADSFELSYMPFDTHIVRVRMVD